MSAQCEQKPERKPQYTAVYRLSCPVASCMETTLIEITDASGRKTYRCRKHGKISPGTRITA